MKVLVLDDRPERHLNLRKEYKRDEVTHCFCTASARFHVTHWQYDVLQLGHDLEEYEAWCPPGYIYDPHAVPPCIERTGHDFAMWLARNPPPNMPLIVIHSVNPDGAKNMQDVLVAAGFRVERLPAE